VYPGGSLLTFQSACFLHHEGDQPDDGGSEHP
jgi:hypothetical protein